MYGDVRRGLSLWRRDQHTLQHTATHCNTLQHGPCMGMYGEVLAYGDAWKCLEMYRDTHDISICDISIHDISIRHYTRVLFMEMYGDVMACGDVMAYEDVWRCMEMYGDTRDTSIRDISIRHYTSVPLVLWRMEMSRV